GYRMRVVNRLRSRAAPTLASSSASSSERSEGGSGGMRAAPITAAGPAGCRPGSDADTGGDPRYVAVGIDQLEARQHRLREQRLVGARHLLTHPGVGQDGEHAGAVEAPDVGGDLFDHLLRCAMHLEVGEMPDETVGPVLLDVALEVGVVLVARDLG